MIFSQKSSLYTANVSSPWYLIITTSYYSILWVIEMSIIPCLDILNKTFCFSVKGESNCDYLKRPPYVCACVVRAATLASHAQCTRLQYYNSQKWSLRGGYTLLSSYIYILLIDYICCSMRTCIIVYTRGRLVAAVVVALFTGEK